MLPLSSLTFIIRNRFFVHESGTKKRHSEQTPNDQILIRHNKKNLENPLALYPEPMTVVGAEVEGKANRLVVGHTGVIGHDRIPVSMS